ncbi:MAG: ribosome assembly factor SBDS [Candidatus Diapherotrites archaeon CG08_land_8_20_14_0_20_30_16]|nr:MAG: ribosome assembly factor SBDS [Candidatus Diapherotrites archaeon CG08_land_8_20_14_0_20_30_16]
MVNIDDARIASYDDKGTHFEILVDPDLALEIKNGNKELANNLSRLLATDEIYKDSRKGDRVSEKVLQDHFGTVDLLQVVDAILKKGHLDLTTEQKRKLAEAKRKELIDYIVRNSINPMNKAPYPFQRVESALEIAKITIDSQKSIESQIDKIIEKLSIVLPMDFKKYVFKVNVPIQYAGRVNGIINKYEILERKWEPASFHFTAKVPAGEKDSFLNTISGLTKGQCVFEGE